MTWASGWPDMQNKMGTIEQMMKSPTATSKGLRAAATALLTLMLLAGAQTSWSQTAPNEPNEPTQAAGEPPPEQAANDAPAPDENVRPDQSPFDYQSSEKISEDRSVSFPVDI
jgi:hypothetical protein